jgi:hypothetical protein
MGSIVQLGDVPAWISVGTGAAGLYIGLRNRRQEQAASWAEMVEELAGLDDIELRRIVEDNPVVAEIVGRAWEVAAETASEDKRRLLGTVAAAALRGDANAEVEDLQFLLRTVIALDPAHVTLLVLIGTPRPGRGQMAGRMTIGSVSREELRAKWSSNPDLLDPGLATLEREGLITKYGLGDNNGETPHSVNDYGERFLDFLLIDAGGWTPTERDTSGPTSDAPQ